MQKQRLIEKLKVVERMIDELHRMIDELPNDPLQSFSFEQVMENFPHMIDEGRVRKYSLSTMKWYRNHGTIPFPDVAQKVVAFLDSGYFLQAWPVGLLRWERVGSQQDIMFWSPAEECKKLEKLEQTFDELYLLFDELKEEIKSDEEIVKLRNDGTSTLVIEADTAYAQGEIIPVLQAEFIEVTEEELGATARGEGGFGSTTGKKAMTWAEVLENHPKYPIIEGGDVIEDSDLEWHQNEGTMPVPKNTFIAVVYRSGVLRRGLQAGMAQTSSWAQDGLESDILFWAREK